MISPRVYQKQIRDLEIEGMEISPKNSRDADALLEKLLSIEKNLEHIKYNIRMDIRAIRRDYIQKIREIENSPKFKNKLKEKKQLIYKRDSKIAPYESIEYLIDDYLRQIKSAKSHLYTAL